MMIGMTTPKAKVAITLSADLLNDVRAQVEAGQARSVSAFIEHAVQAQLAAQADFDVVVAEILAATGGPATRAERAAAKQLLSGSAA